MENFFMITYAIRASIGILILIFMISSVLAYGYKEVDKKHILYCAMSLILILPF